MNNQKVAQKSTFTFRLYLLNMLKILLGAFSFFVFGKQDKVRKTYFYLK